ncbi:membrane-bound serine protease (ClpP class) [Paenibacillus taihuensis]|uniref:Membrane-bound serine protease (ClpP class) n=1 Tax=Paenibacillus taihuensis TaxID=1156355 RepID=A0A3D9SDW1_9BACL|nr:NfeD family protein [Paenibacillus taihuensis]REE93049.1 membrane-bound serine protease (ClpP class) [Paenibacillus taihuensis]
MRILNRMRMFVLLSMAAALLSSLFAAAPAAVSAEEASGTVGSTVYVVEAEDTVEPSLEHFLERAYKEAEDAKASRVLLVLNTLGGRLDSAINIGELIRTSKVPTTAYVQGKAVSAGTYIALNAEQIVMQPGSTIGAAAVVDESGTLITNPKTVSFWTEEMKSAALLHGRDPNIAAAMVNTSLTLELKDLGRTKEKGDVLTLSASDAVKVGYAEYTAATEQDAIDGLKLSQPNIVKFESSVMERIAQFLTTPAVMTLLLILGIAGIAIELMVPGFGLPGIVGLISFAIYFFGHYVAGFAGFEDVVLFIIGILLLVSELFVPSFGILGILGAASLVAGVLMAAPNPKSAGLSLLIALVVAAIIVFVVAKRFAHRGVWNKFILKDALTTAEGYVSTANKSSYLGMKGTTITPLRPAGTVRIGDTRVDVVTSGEFIPTGVGVVVIKVEGTRVVVELDNTAAQ